MFWLCFKLPNEAKKRNIDIMFNTDAGTVCKYYPSVTMGQDMLSYEKGKMQRFGFGFQFFRLVILKYVQNFSLKKSTDAIFLTKYVFGMIQKSAGVINNFMIISHGVNYNFRTLSEAWKTSDVKNKDIKALYVSSVAFY